MKQQIVQAEVLQHGKPHVVTTSSSTKTDTISWEPTTEGGFMVVECARESQIISISLASSAILSSDGVELIVLFKNAGGVFGPVADWSSDFYFKTSLDKQLEHSALAHTVFRFIVRDGNAVLVSREVGSGSSATSTDPAEVLGRVDWTTFALPARSLSSYTGAGSTIPFIKGTGELYGDLVVVERKKGSNTQCHTYHGAFPFNEVNADTGADVWYVDSNDDAIIVAGQTDSTCRLSTDSGLTWGAGGSLTGSTFKSIRHTYGNEWVAAGTSNKIWRSTDNGASWAEEASLTFTPWLFAVDRFSGYLMAFDSAVSTKIAISSDWGDSWTEYSTGGLSNAVAAVYHRGSGYWVAASSGATPTLYYSSSLTGGAMSAGETLTGTLETLISVGPLLIASTTDYIYVLDNPTGSGDTYRYKISKSADGTMYALYGLGLWRYGLGFVYGDSGASTNYVAVGAPTGVWSSGLSWWDTGTWV